LAKTRKWSPSGRQRRALDYAREAGWDYSVTDLTKSVGIGRSTYYRWFRKRAFREWWQSEWERHFALKMARLWGRIFAAACGEKNNASATHAKLIIERFDKGVGPKANGADGEAKPLKTYINVNVQKVTGQPDD